MPINLKLGGITQLEVDAVVNAANTSLLGGGGVDGAIHRVGGAKILEECRKIRARQGGCAVGEAVISNAGNLPASYVIHTVGPVWNGGENGEVELLANAYQNSLRLAVKYKIFSLAFPNISTGAYGFPKKLAAQIAIREVKDFIQGHSAMEIVFICFDEENYHIYQQMLEK